MLQVQLMKRQATSNNLDEREETHIQQDIAFAVISWNLFGSIPPPHSLQMLFAKLIKSHFKQPPDAIFFATQECQRSLAMSFFCEEKAAWESLLAECAPSYTLMHSQTLQGLHNAVLVKKDQASCYSLQRKEVLRAGTCNLLGNKGAVSISFNLLGRTFQFINCHLPAHQNESDHRNEVLVRILSELVEEDKRTEVIVCGDLNYRIQMEKQQYRQLIQGKDNTDTVMKYSKLLAKDQLLNQQLLKEQFLPYFKEGPINFAPSYKLGVDDQRYCRERIPGWTDRIFYRKGTLKQLFYGCEENIFGSDHRPIVSGFTVETEEGLSIFPEEFINVGPRNNCSLI